MEMIWNSTSYVKKAGVFLMAVSCMGCEYESAKPDSAPVIYISKIVDTAYLNTFYNSETVEVEPCEGVTVTGKVNTSKIGTYYLDHDYTDKFGNKSVTVTRTVHVVENSAAFLNGPYRAVCTCTTVKASESSVAAENYTAYISPSPLKNHFELVNLKIGPDFVIPITSLQRDKIQVEYYRHQGGTSSGTVSLAKNSFTIESEVNGNFPVTKYRCKNVFVKSDPDEKKRSVKQ
ncbi:hypothetical protein CNR22_13765 [Sphingobacteriaceae bacterium]|nr:hypothetical protein CNR22_13765 [Sphingobacteriaceae bacterium]